MPDVVAGSTLLSKLRPYRARGCWPITSLRDLSLTHMGQDGASVLGIEVNFEDFTNPQVILGNLEALTFLVQQDRRAREHLANTDYRQPRPRRAITHPL